MDRDVGVEGTGGDSEGVPLLRRHGGNLDEEPLSRFIFHAGLGELDLHGVVRVADHFGDFRFSSSTDFTVDTFDEVQAAAEEFPAPAFVADAVGPEHLACEGGVRVSAVPDEAARSMGVHAKQEGDEEVVRVPEGLVGLLADLMVGSGVHEKHAQKHHMTRYSASLSIVDLDRRLRTKLGFLDVEEIDVVSADVYSSE